MRTTTGLAATALAATLLGLAAPAGAASITLHDQDDYASLADISAVTVRHTDDRVVVRTRFDDLRRDGAADMRINLDTDPTRAGAEYALLAGLFEGTDYTLRRVVDGKLTGLPLTCSHRLTIDWSTDVARFSAGRGCLGKPDEVRVQVKATDGTDASHPITDWLGGVRHWTRWVARG